MLIDGKETSCRIFIQYRSIQRHQGGIGRPETRKTAVSMWRHSSQPHRTLRNRPGHMVFNILFSNTDDYAAFRNGKEMALTLACGILPQLRMGGEASQAILISCRNNPSHLAVCRENAGSSMPGQSEGGLLTSPDRYHRQTFHETGEKSALQVEMTCS